MTPQGKSLPMLGRTLHRSRSRLLPCTAAYQWRSQCSNIQADRLFRLTRKNLPDSRSRLLPCTAAYHWRSQCRSTQAGRLPHWTSPIRQGKSARRLCRRPGRCQRMRPQQSSKTCQHHIANTTPWRVSCTSLSRTICKQLLKCWSTFRCRTLYSLPPRRCPPRERRCLRGMTSTRLIPQKRHTCPRRTECMSTRAGHPLPSCIFPLCTESILRAVPRLNMFPPGMVNSCRIQQILHISLLRMAGSEKTPQESTFRSDMACMTLLRMPLGSPRMCLPCNENMPTPTLHSCTCPSRTLSNPIRTLPQAAPKTCPVRS